MALFCQNMVGMAAEIAAYDPTYEDMVVKFLEHFLWIAAAMNRARTACGMRKTDSIMTCCGYRMERHQAQGSLHGRPPSALRDHRG